MKDFELTKDQKQASVLLDRFLESDSPLFSLTGSAGVGKTHLLSEIPAKLPYGGMIGCAPTHKAVSEMVKRLPDNECMTIHRFLGLRPKRSKDKTYLVRRNDYDPTTFFNIRMVGVDEASMVSNEIKNFILDDIKVWDRKYIALGDPYQLNPVDEINSPLLEMDFGDNQYELKQIVRQAADSPIIKAATHIRDSILAGKAPDILEGRTDASSVQIMHRAEWFKTLESYVENHVPDSFRAIAWRNDTVRDYNQAVRGMRGEDISLPFSPGEFVVVNEAYSIDDTIIFNTGMEFEIVDMTDYEYPAFPELRGWTVQLKADDVIMPETVNVLDLANCGQAYKQKLANLAQHANGNGDWRPYYRLQENWCDLRPLHALTGHKCLPLDSLILTAGGAVRLSDVESSVTSGKGLERLVTEYADTGLKQVFQIKTRSGRTFKSSPEHQFLVLGDYVKAGDIKEGDFLSLWRGTPLEITTPEFDLDYYMYGYLVGNGCYSYASNRVDVTLLADSNIIPDIKKFLGKYGSKVYTYIKQGNKAITLSVESKDLRQELLGVGLERLTAVGKKPCIFETYYQKANFIQGLMDSDGSCSAKQAKIRFVSVSEQLIDETLMLLQEFGIIGRKSVMKLYHTQHSQAYTLSITGRDVITYRDLIGFRIGYKQDRLDSVCNLVGGKSNVDYVPKALNVQETLAGDIRNSKFFNKRGCGLFQGGNRRFSQYLKHKHLSYFQLEQTVSYLQNQGVEVSKDVLGILSAGTFYDEVVSATLTAEFVEMADITVDQDHSFIYNGAVVHNSQGSTFDNVFLDYRDIYANRILLEADRCLYVALTRARYNVFVLL